MVTRTCLQCGKEFQASGNQRYCCDECAAIAARIKRQQYLKDHPERLEYQRKYNRARRARIKAETERIEKRARANANIIDFTAYDEHIKELTDEAAKGDLSAKMILTLHKYDKLSVEYWSAFREYTQDFYGRYNLRRTTTINDIPVTDDLFAEKVVESIKELRIIVLGSVKETDDR